MGSFKGSYKGLGVKGLSIILRFTEKGCKVALGLCSIGLTVYMSHRVVRALLFGFRDL